MTSAADNYAPTVYSDLRSRIVVESFGEAHARRQADSRAALERINFGATGIVVTVRCKKRHRLASVYRTSDGPMIAVYQGDHVDADMRRLRRETTDDLRYAERVATDVLNAADDFDLEAHCRCGRFNLPRDDIRGAVRDGHDTLVV